LDWDMKSERAYADGPMVEVAEEVINIYSRTEHLPAKFRMSELPTSLKTGPFTLNSKKKRSEQLGLTDLQCRLLAALREMGSLGKSLQHMKAGEKVHVQNKGKLTGKDTAADDMRKEYIKWFEQSKLLSKQLAEVKKSKKGGGGELEQEVEQLLNSLAENDRKIKEKITSIHKLEGDVQSMRYELVNLRRERAELQEKNLRMSKDSLPVLEKMKALVGKSQGAVEILTSDTAAISELFRLMVQENKRIAEERDGFKQELDKVQKQLKAELRKNTAKEEEVQKKETLYLRTMAARKAIHESCQEQRAYIEDLDKQVDQQEEEMHEMSKFIAAKDVDIAQLQEELKRAKRRADELELQKQACLSEYEAITGHSCDKLLSRFKAVPTLPPSVFA